MSIMLAECKVWAEEPGVELRITPHAGVLEVSILKAGEIVATGTVARWRWERIVQATMPPPADLNQ